MMKLILFFVVSCLALHNGKGAPTSAKYKHVKCNPDGNKANCVVHESPEIPWNADLPSKLPASAAEHLETKPVEDESLLWEEEDEKDEEDEEIEQAEEEEEVEEVVEDERDEEDEEDEEDDEMQMASQPLVPEEGSGIYEGSGISEDSSMPDLASMAETGSGDSDTDPFRGGQADRRGMRRLSRSLLDEAKPAEHEMKEDHLLQP